MKENSENNNFLSVNSIYHQKCQEKYLNNTQQLNIYVLNEIHFIARALYTLLIPTLNQIL